MMVVHTNAEDFRVSAGSNKVPGRRGDDRTFSVDPDRYALVRDGQMVRFSRKHFDLIEALSSAHGRVLPRSFLLDRLEIDMESSDRAIDQIVKRIRGKIKEIWPDAEDPIGLVYGVGYYWRMPHEIAA